MAGEGFGLGEIVSSLTDTGQAVLLAAIALTVAGALAGGDSGAFIAALGAALLALLLAEAHIFAVKLAAATRLKARRVLEGVPVDSSPVKVTLVLENPTPIPLETVIVRDNPPPRFTVQDQPVFSGALKAKSIVEASYTIIPLVGRHEWGGLEVEVVDPLGFFSSTVTPEAKGGMVVVLPKPLPARLAVAPRHLYTPGGRGVRGRGYGTVFLEVREYMPDDDARLIDWKASARLGKLVVKVFEAEVVEKPLIVLDATPTMFIRCGRLYPISLASALAAAAAMASHGPVGVVVVDWRGVSRSVVAGRRAAGRVIASLTAWPPLGGGGGCGESRARLVAGLASRSEASIIVTDFCLSTRMALKYLDSAARLRGGRRGRILFIVPSLERAGGVCRAYTALREELRPAMLQGLVRFAGSPREALEAAVRLVGGVWRP